MIHEFFSQYETNIFELSQDSLRKYNVAILQNWRPGYGVNGVHGVIAKPKMVSIYSVKIIWMVVAMVNGINQRKSANENA